MDWKEILKAVDSAYENMPEETKKAINSARKIIGVITRYRRSADTKENDSIVMNWKRKEGNRGTRYAKLYVNEKFTPSDYDKISMMVEGGLTEGRETRFGQEMYYRDLPEGVALEEVKTKPNAEGIFERKFKYKIGSDLIYETNKFYYDSFN